MKLDNGGGFLILKFEERAMKSWLSIIIGFLLLLFVYHFPEFFESFWITAVFKTGFLVVAVILSRLQGWKFLEGFGLSLTGNWHRLLFAGLLIGIASFTLSIILSVGFNFEKIESSETISFFLKSLPLISVMTFFPSIAEDILTRGYLYGHLKFLKPTLWILLSAFIYVLNHIWRLNEGLPVLTYLFLLGLVLGFCTFTYQSLWLALGIHWGANIVFELSNQGLKLTDIGNQNASTWVLASVWGLVLVILIFIQRTSLKGYSLK